MLSQGQGNWSDVEATIYSQVEGVGQKKISCPSCQHTRKNNRRDKPLSVNSDGSKIVYHCHHCGVQGLINMERKLRR